MTMLLHTRRSLSNKKFLAQKPIIEMEHPSSSPDLDPNDFRLFQKIKYALKGRIFRDIESIQRIVTAALKAIPQQGFKKCF